MRNSIRDCCQVVNGKTKRIFTKKTLTNVLAFKEISLELMVITINRKFEIQELLIITVRCRKQNIIFQKLDRTLLFTAGILILRFKGLFYNRSHGFSTQFYIVRFVFFFVILTFFDFFLVFRCFNFSHMRIFLHLNISKSE